MGDYLTQLLTENYGYQVVHLKEQFDMAGGELDRSAAYDYARDYLEPYLQENPDIQVIIDLHRDGVPEDRHLVTEINGKPTAQILFYNGLSYTTSKGSLDYLPNPYIQQTWHFPSSWNIRQPNTILNFTGEFTLQVTVTISTSVPAPFFWKPEPRPTLSRK
mgnify:CR=1 FL=1